MKRRGAPIPAGYLSKKGGRWRAVRLLDAAILLYHVHRGASLEQVGFEDANNTLEMMTQKMSKFKVLLDPSVLESALWSANLMDEDGKFWSPGGETFEEFSHRVLDGDKFDRAYNLIEKKGSK